MSDWKANLVRDPAGIAEVVRASKRIAVLGIKPESRSDQAAHYVPQYLQEAGLEIEYIRSVHAFRKEDRVRSILACSWNPYSS